VLVVVGSHHRQYAERELADWPHQNIVYQPKNRDTAPGILLPLAHITNRDPKATIVVFPSDHFILDEVRFMSAVKKALAELSNAPSKMVLLGMSPQHGEETEYGYIVGAARNHHNQAAPVAGFVEKPSLEKARELIQRGALWNTMVFAVDNCVLWDMVQRTSPALYHAFRLIQMILRNECSPSHLEHVYEVIPHVNFSTAICEPLATRLAVLPVPDVGWSDWGTAGSIVRTLKKLGRLEAFTGRVQRSQLLTSWQVANPPDGHAPSARPASLSVASS
jgi:mannose-1-phosphate guanylyltransferase